MGNRFDMLNDLENSSVNFLEKHLNDNQSYILYPSQADFASSKEKNKTLVIGESTRANNNKEIELKNRPQSWSM